MEVIYLKCFLFFFTHNKLWFDSLLFGLKLLFSKTVEEKETGGREYTLRHQILLLLFNLTVDFPGHVHLRHRHQTQST